MFLFFKMLITLLLDPKKEQMLKCYYLLFFFPPGPYFKKQFLINYMALTWRQKWLQSVFEWLHVPVGSR